MFALPASLKRPSATVVHKVHRAELIRFIDDASGIAEHQCSRLASCNVWQINGVIAFIRQWCITFQDRHTGSTAEFNRVVLCNRHQLLVRLKTVVISYPKRILCDDSRYAHQASYAHEHRPKLISFYTHFTIIFFRPTM